MPRPLLPLLVALLAVPAVDAAAQTRVPVDTAAERERARDAARARRDREREVARARERERRDSIAAEREARDDMGLGEQIGAVVRESVRAGVRGAAEGLRAAQEALREVDADWDDDAGAGVRSAPTRLDTTVSVGREPSVDLSLVNGPVTVTAWDRAEVRVRGYSERAGLRFESTGGAVRVYTPRTRGSRGDERVEVYVPVGTRLTAASVSGDVRVRGVRGDLDARSVSGDVDVESTARRAALTSVSGDVRATGLDGDVRVESVSGDVTLDGVGGQVDAKTTSGEVTVRRARLNRLRAETVSGDLSYDGTLARDGRYDLSSHSGEIRVALPANVGAALSVRTYSGSIDTDVPLTLQPHGNSQRSGKRLEFTLGGGGARVTAESFSGDITIARPGAPTPPLPPTPPSPR